MSFYISRDARMHYKPELLMSSALNVKSGFSKYFVAQTVYRIEKPFSPMD
jgi:hypothetical protein